MKDMIKIGVMLRDQHPELDWTDPTAIMGVVISSAGDLVDDGVGILEDFIAASTGLSNEELGALPLSGYLELVPHVVSVHEGVIRTFTAARESVTRAFPGKGQATNGSRKQKPSRISSELVSVGGKSAS